ncbi:endo-1,4-beta-xylanase [Coraliomargarita sp. SDUM461004]|uniref:Endo-1,4-beta-xylanase n=1 Tax=Thalassobacterium sedimentorum TaxID=3041258 RepID=A0ABU1AJH4_9BACT|nr:endo-1,4-beta-xylanase [Coraliomargarita sp. SDUM461004]MDQ8194794.1 endo-1,4-beta-xylanase [Coraliomargarita sp. SDUM461004]
MKEISTVKYNAMWSAPEISERIQSGIEKNRKASSSILVLDADGKPLQGAKVECLQTNSVFHFGANIFKLDEFETDELNARYEKAYLELFNAATVPFYWKTLELERGKPRFDADSVPVLRRPPPDKVVSYCEKHGLRMHGHYLVWDLYTWSAPDWVSSDPAKAKENAQLFRERILEIGKRYGHRIHRWDAVNEAFRTPERIASGKSCSMPEDYVRQSFEWGAEAFPPSTRFDINDVTAIWIDEGLETYSTMVEKLVDAQAPIGGVGMQFHFSNISVPKILDGTYVSPEMLFKGLDTMGRFNLPIHVSEITMPAVDNSPQGQAVQAEIARNFYRLWFSHPAVDGITWWNFTDVGAVKGQDHLLSGLLNSDLMPKLAYNALKDLIHNEWRTHHQDETDESGQLQFRGFSGDYKITVQHGDKQVIRNIAVNAKNEASTVTIKLI